MLPISLKSENSFTELSPGLYLDSKGKIVGTLPETYTLNKLPFSLDLPDSVKDTLKGVDLATIPGILRDVAPLLGEIGISQKVIDIAGACIGIVIGLSSVVGTVGAAFKLLQVLGIFGGGGGDGQANALNKIYAIVQGIHQNVIALEQQLTIDKVVRDGWGKIVPAQLELLNFLQDETPDRTDLKEYLKSLREVQAMFLTGSFQSAPFREAAFANQEWFSYRDWLEPRSDFDYELGPDIKTIQDGTPRWDYLPYVGAICAFSNLFLSYCKAFDPAFRTTRQFEKEIKDLATGLDAFAQRITAGILWTREFKNDAMDIDRLNIDILGFDGWPVGAVDTCSGVSAFIPRWKEGVQWKDRMVYSSHIVKFDNLDESLQRARNARYLNWLAVFNASGAPKVLQYAALAREVASPPATSETVETEIQKSGNRKYIKTIKHATPYFLGCDEQEFDASVFHVQRTTHVWATTQPRDDQDFYEIPYTFWIESYYVDISMERGSLIERVSLRPDGSDHAVSFKALTFDWEVYAPQLQLNTVVEQTLLGLRVDKFVHIARERFQSHSPSVRLWSGPPLWTEIETSAHLISSEIVTAPDAPDVPGVITKREEKQITLDYELQRLESDIKIKLHNRPAEGNFAGVFFVIEEQANSDMEGRPGPIIRTMVDISMIGEELHVPHGYLEYIELCEARQRGIVDEINRKRIRMRIPGPHPPDPYKYEEVADWVRQVLQENPDILDGELLLEARRLAQVRVVPRRIER